MKKIILTLCAAGAFFAVQAQNLTVKIDGWENEPIHCIKRVLGGESSNDTITAQNGVITIKNDGSRPISVMLAPTRCIVVNGNSTSISGDHSVSAVVFVDKPTSVTGKFAPPARIEYTVSGNPFVEEKQKFDLSIANYGTEITKIMERARADEDVMEEFNQLMKRYASEIAEYITANPDSDVSAYYLTEITDKEILQKLVDTLTPRARNGAFKAAIDKHIETYITNNGWVMMQ